MDKLQELLNFTNANGEVITFFDGKITLSQIVVILGVIVIIGLILKFIKGTFKLIATVIAVCFLLVHFNIASPTDLSNIAEQIKKTGVEAYQTYVENSDNLKIEGNELFICVGGDKWINISEISSMINCNDGRTIVVGDQSYVIEDESVLDLLDDLK